MSLSRFGARAWVAVTALGAAQAATLPVPAPGELQLAWLDAQGLPHHVVLDARGQVVKASRAPWPDGAKVARAAGVAGAAEARVPLGSLWKLAAYARLTEVTATAAATTPLLPHEPDYVCTGHAPEEAYCCEPGQRIDRATALWRSCGLYFAAPRLALPASALGPTVQALPPALEALRQPDIASERSTVPIDDWLRWLTQWAPATQQAARDDLLNYWLVGPGRDSLGRVGSRLQLKTFTLPLQPGSPERWAGASGWLSDGRPLWLAARGSSKAVVPRWAPIALRHIDQAEGRADARPTAREDTAREDTAREAVSLLPLSPLPHPQAPCVQVAYLQRYPIARLLDARGHEVPPAEAPLPAGDYRAEFRPGHQLPLHSQGDLFWRPNPSTNAGARPNPRTAGQTGSNDRNGPHDQSGLTTGQLSGRHTLDDYVARVVDREGQATATAAAQALAVAARSYVLQTGRAQGGCLAIDDSSAAQRVAPRPPSAAARAAAAFTAGLVLRQHVGQYHATQARPGVMAWQDAVAQAEAGQGFDAILATAYGPDPLQAAFGTTGTQCEPLPDAQAWLNRQLPPWRRRLQGQPGFTPVSGVEVCRLQAGLPHARPRSARLFVRDFRSLDDRLTLAHEYLHLAFAGHPRATQEAFIEQQARALLGAP